MATIKKGIAPVPTAAEFLDVILSKTQRKTPTVIHNGFKITRIRSFYMKKVKFTQQSFEEKLDAILTDFPIMDNLHPFLSSLLNVLYDKNHYKLALGQLNTCRHLIVSVGKDYCRLLKFGDSLYRCKQLKKAALGRMATIMRRQKDPLAYLEQVRQHMSRLPTIDPTTRTLLICGYPNVGKSSFVNKVTRADVDVQPYAFTTKSLFVGHMDYKYLRWQVIDTPGVLDHPLEEMNTIEMQSITALAHLRSCVLYFMDLSEQCGYTVEAQIQLYQSIKPLFTNKPTFIVINKIDVMRPSDLDPARKAMLDSILAEDSVTLLELSCVSDEGVMDVRNACCDALLAHRVESKEKTKRVENVANRIRVAVPVARDGMKREAFIPAKVATRRAYDKLDPERRVLERDLEEENGGAGAYTVDMKKNYLLKDPSWKYDIMPEVQDGKNIADFIDPDIVEKLEELEREEERLEAAGFYDDEDELDSDEDAVRTTASAIRDKKAHIRLVNAQKNKLQNRPVIPRTSQHRTLSEMTRKLTEAGYDPTRIEERARVLAKARGLIGDSRKRDADDMEEMDDEDAWSEDAGDDSMEVDGERSAKRSKTSIVPKGKRTPATNRETAGLGSMVEAVKATKLRGLHQRQVGRLAKGGEGDRHIPTRMPKYLYANVLPARLPRQVWKQIATCPHSSTIIFKRGKLFRLKKKPLPTPLRAVAAPALIAQPPQIAKVAGPLPVKPPPFNAAPSTTTAPLAQSKASSSASGVARTTSTAQTSEFTATASKPKVSRYSNGRKKKVIAADSEDEDDFIQPPILTLRPAGALEQLAPRDDPPEKAYYFNRWKSSHATADDVDNFSHLLAVSKDNLIDALLHCDLKKQITRKDLLALERGVALRAGSGRQFGGRWSWYEGMNAENQALVFLRDIMDDKVAFLVLPGVTNIVDLTTLGVIAQRVKKLIVYVDVKGNDYTYVSILPSELAAACTKLGNVTKNLFDEKKSTKPSPSESLRLLADALETIEKFNVGSEVERLTVLMVSGYLARLVMIVGITINRAIGHQRWFDSAGLDRTIVPRFVEVEDNDEDEDFEHQRIEAADNSAKDSKYSSSSPSIPQSIVLLARSIRKSIPGEALEWKSCGNASCPLILYPSSFVEATVVWTGPDGVDRCNTCRRHFAKYVREWPMKTGTIKVNVGAYLLDADGNSDVTECEAPKCPYKRSGVFRHWGDGRYRCEGCSNFKTINYGNDWPIKSISIEIDEKGVEVEVIDEINVRYSSHRARYKDEILVEYGVPTGGCLNDGLFGCPFAQGPDRARPKFGRCSSCYNHHKKHGAMDWPETPDGTILNRIALKRNMRKGIPVYDADILRIMTEYLDTSE